MGTTTCASCNAKCGDGTADVRAPNKSDPIYVAMCKILCETRKEICEGDPRHKGKAASQVAEAKAAQSQGLQQAIDKSHPGATKAVNQHRYVRFDNAPKSWDRVKVGKEVVERHLDTVIRQIEKQAARAVATKVGKAAARSWLKLVPILNIASTAYDVYDLASTGVEVYQQIKQARANFTGDVYSVRPDVAVVGENGQLKDIYDFKFDGDDWQPGQKEMYDADLKASGAGDVEAKAVNSKTCGCDGPAVVPRTGG